MRISLTVRADEQDPSPGADAAGPDDLRRWLAGQPELRGRVRRAPASAPPPGTMGAGTDVVLALLEPGGVATVLAGAVVAWLQTRRGSRTVTLTRPDGTEITISSTEVEPLDAQQAVDLAERLAIALEQDGHATEDGGSEADGTSPAS
ncbi:hypothetical protein KN815_13780 [Streptomyces sp. 4503]|uniref:Uncharacterized protein n=1 Tax=Streptomyces niphimycinicus TaxID=2842201 RepID=A0ABS6CDV9_9ACTN|nr:hypothetical protein [Streptomyces niphimycinicus]MBU3865101.1 hypothetical protein [Streptomyces niphimycinicus]